MLEDANIQYLLLFEALFITIGRKKPNLRPAIGPPASYNPHEETRRGSVLPTSKIRR